jgi:Spy/CpxP family protein refolding chaperone
MHGYPILYPKIMKILLFIFVTSAVHGTDTSHTSEYAGQQLRTIKSLSADDVEALQAGKGWGFAKAAELNGYPGPRHLLDMRDEINLSETQVEQIEALYAHMLVEAVPLGKKMVQLEQGLNESFAQQDINAESLEQQVMAIARVRGALRLVHLRKHLDAAALLTAEQISQYNKLRGYAKQQPCDAVPEGHDPKMWNKHHGCQ